MNIRAIFQLQILFAINRASISSEGNTKLMVIKTFSRMTSLKIVELNAQVEVVDANVTCSSMPVVLPHLR